MSISSIAGGQSVAQMKRPTSRPPSFENLDVNKDSSLTQDELKASAPKGASGTDADKRAEACSWRWMLDTAMADQRQAMAFVTQQMSGSSNADIFAQTDTDGNAPHSRPSASLGEVLQAVVRFMLRTDLP